MNELTGTSLMMLAHQQMVVNLLIDGSGDGASATIAFNKLRNELIENLEKNGDSIDSRRPAQWKMKLHMPWLLRHCNNNDSDHVREWVREWISLMQPSSSSKIYKSSPLWDAVRDSLISCQYVGFHLQNQNVLNFCGDTDCY